MRRPRGKGLAGGVNNPQILIANALVNLNGDNLVLSGGNVAQMLNQGTGGAAYDVDVVLGTAANGKPHPSGAVLLYGGSGDNLSTPNSAAITFAGDRQIKFSAAADDWTPATNNTIGAQWENATNRRCFLTRVVATTGLLQLQISGNGVGSVTYNSTEAPTIANGQRLWVDIGLDVDNGDSDSECTFLVSTDGVNFSQLGDVVKSGGTVSLFDSIFDLEVGVHNGTSEPFLGSIYSFELYNGIGGTLVASMNAADQTDNANGATSTFTSSATGETWTQNGNAFIQNTSKTVVHSIGSWGLETTAGQDITVFTAYFVARITTTPGADMFLFDAKATAGKSVRVFTDQSNTDKWTIDAGGTPKALSAAFDNEWNVITIEYTAGATTKLTVGSNSVTGDAGSEVLEFVTLFADLAAGNNATLAIAHASFSPYAHSQTQVKAIQGLLTAEYRV